MGSTIEKAEQLAIQVVPADIMDEFNAAATAAFLIAKKNMAPWGGDVGPSPVICLVMICSLRFFQVGKRIEAAVEKSGSKIKFRSGFLSDPAGCVGSRSIRFELADRAPLRSHCGLPRLKRPSNDCVWRFKSGHADRYADDNSSPHPTRPSLNPD